MYEFALLKPSRSQNAEKHNAPLLGKATFGIEVSEPELAIRCGLGNVDPQHSEGLAHLAAIEACINLPLPPEESLLVTLRPDADAVGAMALLDLRADGKGVTPDMLERIGIIAKEDTFAHGPWPGRRGLPAKPEDLGRLVGGDPRIAELNESVMDHDSPFEGRVVIARNWILAEVAPWTAISARDLAPYAAAAHSRRERLINSLVRGDLDIRAVADSRIAVVEGMAEGGSVRLGYGLAPVVVALNPFFRFLDGQPHVKFTVCQYSQRYVNLPAVARELCAREPGWGGSPCIIGSPQGCGSRLGLEDVVAAVKKNLFPLPQS